MECLGRAGGGGEVKKTEKSFLNVFLLLFNVTIKIDRRLNIWKY